MRRIWNIFIRDLRNVSHNTVALLIIMGLAVMPSLYAWFNIAGGWDPYGNTGQVQVALANSDEGLSGTLLPVHVNVGERVVSSLSGSDKVNYVVTTEDKALEGVRSGEYYAAVVIPEDFTQNLLSVFSPSPTHPDIDFYVNEKRNAIASIVTGKVSGSVQNMVNEGFTEAVADAAADLFEQLSGMLDDDSMLALASNLNISLDDALRVLDRSSEDINAYKQVVTSIMGVMESSKQVLGTNSASLEVSDMLSEAATGVRQFDEAVGTAKQGTSAAIDGGSNAVADLKAALDEAFAAADGKTGNLADALGRVVSGAQGLSDQLWGLYNKVEGLENLVSSLSTSLEAENLSYAHKVELDLSDYKARILVAIERVDAITTTCQKSIDDLQTARGNAATSKNDLAALAEEARAGIENVRSSYEGSVSLTLNEVASSIDEVANQASGISSDLKTKVNNLSPILDDATNGLKSLEESLDKTSTKLNDTAKGLRTLRDNLEASASSSNLDMIRSILGTDPSLLVDFITAPVELDREPFFPVENNGSAMTPFYTTMALWVGGTLMGILLYTGISERAREETGAEPRHAYFGRLLFFLMIGACQSTILLLGDLFFLKVQCVNPLLFLLTGWIASAVFINIIYSLSTSFGDVGKAIGVLIMVLQVAGSGGTFPVQMLPPLFQKLYPFLPFVHSENAFRAAMFGTYGNDWTTSIGTLALFLVPALLLGLVLRKPLVPVNEWIEEKMEETGIM